jgi:hypothetical protein
MSFFKGFFLQNLFQLKNFVFVLLGLDPDSGQDQPGSSSEKCPKPDPD